MRALVSTLALLLAAPAAADVRGTHLLGERMAGAGGAAVALADEPTGGVRNPAGLASIGGIQGSVSVSAYQLLVQRQAAALRVGDRSLDLDVVRFSTFPAALGVAIPLVPRDGEGRHVLAINVLVPEQRSAGGQVETAPGDATEAAPGAAMGFETRGRTFQFAAAWGWAITDSVRVGAMASYSLDEVHLSSRLVIEPPDGSFLVGASQFSGLAGSLHLDVGFQIAVDPAWVLGASLRSESIRLHGSGEGSSVSATSSAGASKAMQRIDLMPGLRTERRDPWRIALGGAWLGPDGTRVAADLYVHVAQAAYLDIQDPDLPAFDGLGRVNPSQPFGQSRQRVTTFDGAAGIEAPVTEDVTLRGGILTSLSPWPAPDPTDPRHPARIHALGATFGVALPSEHGAMSLALSYLVGFGEGLAARVAVDGGISWERVDIVQHQLTAVIGGAVRF